MRRQRRVLPPAVPPSFLLLGHMIFRTDAAAGVVVVVATVAAAAVVSCLNLYIAMMILASRTVKTADFARIAISYIGYLSRYRNSAIATIALRNRP